MRGYQYVSSLEEDPHVAPSTPPPVHSPPIHRPALAHSLSPSAHYLPDFCFAPSPCLLPSPSLLPLRASFSFFSLSLYLSFPPQLHSSLLSLDIKSTTASVRAAETTDSTSRNRSRSTITWSETFAFAHSGVSSSATSLKYFRYHAITLHNATEMTRRQRWRTTCSQ